MSDIEALKDLLDEIRLEAGGLRTRLPDKEERRERLRAQMAATILAGMFARSSGWSAEDAIGLADTILMEVGS